MNRKKRSFIINLVSEIDFWLFFFTLQHSHFAGMNIEIKRTIENTRKKRQVQYTYCSVLTAIEADYEYILNTRRCCNTACIIARLMLNAYC